jgi:predicted transcriptional regulator of viral defense system
MPHGSQDSWLDARQLALINKLNETQILTVRDVEETLDIINECMKLATSQAVIVTLLAYLIILGGQIIPKQLAKGDSETGTLDEWIDVYNKVELALMTYPQVADILN